MDRYYARKLSAERLRLCYEIAPPRIRQYLEAETDFVLSRMEAGDRVLDLGCGYGRVFQQLAEKASFVVGVDNAWESLLMAQEIHGGDSGPFLLEMDGETLGILEGRFDRVICIQNGISAFKADPQKLVEEAIRVTRPGGSVLFSSYSERIWEDRLEWFRLQSERGLVGEIDWNATGHGIILCKDGFKARTFTREDFMELTRPLQRAPLITEVDGSSLFCEIPV